MAFGPLVVPLPETPHLKHRECMGSKEIGSEQIPKSTIAALGKMPGSEGNQSAWFTTRVFP